MLLAKGQVEFLLFLESVRVTFVLKEIREALDLIAPQVPFFGPQHLLIGKLLIWPGVVFSLKRVLHQGLPLKRHRPNLLLLLIIIVPNLLLHLLLLLFLAPKNLLQPAVAVVAAVQLHVTTHDLRRLRVAEILGEDHGAALALHRTIRMAIIITINIIILDFSARLLPLAPGVLYHGGLANTCLIG